jgi:glutathione S-transferase
MIMTPPPDALILHQYEVSPFSEKVRVMLGIKGLRWHACDQPVILPKPEMVALTGGYRRIPMLQIGADLYFDSQLIIEELDRRFPSPPAFAGVGVGLSCAFADWVEGDLFRAIVTLLFGGDWDYDAAFTLDRSAMMSRAFDPAERTAMRPQMIVALERHLAVIEAQLRDGRRFLGGDQPGAVDAVLRGQTAFIRWGRGTTARHLEGFPMVRAWDERVIALGHGERQPDVGRAQANAVAAASTPGAPPAIAVPGGAFMPGDAVTIDFLDANTPPLEAQVTAAGADRISVRRAMPGIGDVGIHLPLRIAKIRRAP